MTTLKLSSQDKILHKEISRVLTDIVISQNASDTDITSGLYKPISKIASLINISNLSPTQRKIQAVTVEVKKPRFRISK